MPERKTKLGLVLSGGGAKGAYEVGVIRALAEYGIEPQVVSGASIGAINGSIVASSSDIAQGRSRAGNDLEGNRPEFHYKNRFVG